MKPYRENLLKSLFSMQDEKYRLFSQKLIPNVPLERFIGIRTPALRAFAKQYSRTDDCREFLSDIPHYYIEENNLHGMIISLQKDAGSAIEMLDAFLPFVDNWATCDLISPVSFKKLPTCLEEKAHEWMKSDKTYTIRYGIGVFMSFYLDGGFKPDYPKWIADIKSDEYYVNMMIAWYFATALYKQYEAVIPYIEERRLDPWTHNKAIQKAIESLRIPPEQKAYLKTLKVKITR